MTIQIINWLTCVWLLFFVISILLYTHEGLIKLLFYFAIIVLIQSFLVLGLFNHIFILKVDF